MENALVASMPDDQFLTILNQETNLSGSLPVPPQLKFNGTEGRFYLSNGQKDEQGKDLYDDLGESVKLHIVLRKNIIKPAYKENAKVRYFSREFEDDMFDLVICMLLLHELSQGSQSAVLNEVMRVLKVNGSLLLIDFQPGPSKPLQGWISKALILISEMAAGGEHFKNYRQFMARKGLATLIEHQNLKIQNERILAGGTFAIYLVTS